MITKLVERGFVSDPVKGWKAKVAKDSLPDDGDESEAPVTDYASSTSTTSGGPDFQYLLSMAIMSLSKERKDELLRQRDQKVSNNNTVMYFYSFSFFLFFYNICIGYIFYIVLFELLLASVLSHL